MRLMDRLVTLLAAALLLASPLLAAGPSIPGCADIEAFQQNASAVTDFCFCRTDAESASAALFCTYGSDSEQLLRALDALYASDFALTQISINHLRWKDSLLSKEIALRMGNRVQEMIIGQCGAHGLQIEDGAFGHLADVLVTLSVYDCGLKEVPAAVRPLRAIRKLSFPDNLITTIEARPLENKKNLIYLNLEGNFINSAEDSAFEGLGALQTLLIGEHNFANETVIEEIQKLGALQVLDMSKMDGVATLSNGQFENNTRLETLILKGCSLKSLGNESFLGVRNLKQLDLRLNLLETVANESFRDAKNLVRLSLEGNYLKSINASMWNGLKSLQAMDLGWNELVNISVRAFSPLGATLHSLKLSNNPKLATIEEGAFEGLRELRTLNVSSCRVKEIGRGLLAPLEAAEILDLSHNELLGFGPEVFAKTKNLRVLRLNDNLLRSIDGAFLDDLEQLEVVDLSNNPWICDKKIYSLVKAVEEKYRRAFEQKKDFLLENANNTVCSRPYSLRFKALFDLREEELAEYVEALDTTTPEPTTAAANDTEDALETSTINLGALLVGAASSNASFHFDDNREIPEFDVNARWADDFKTDAERKWLGAAAGGSILVISAAILATVAHHLKKKRREEKANTPTVVKMR
ncbi:hypothetical protein QR680_008998 [Steinernema hermaphroditum]|uniref:LRRCT domain-containing protein n=1 Tax=Steinernema hermaphroditum TaxID=289476 RepID=A0AA39IL07_9BILA|nr:hypothetical protein QR680_008998 [Steinernema hermaphroditum]